MIKYILVAANGFAGFVSLAIGVETGSALFLAFGLAALLLGAGIAVTWSGSTATKR
ncbi:MAG: hypothetical protein MAG715_00351 [Methanonatronarchaeales archaeon]|nr:hypothetical protein [Methanonatronarchaeales archaeon]